MLASPAQGQGPGGGAVPQEDRHGGHRGGHPVGPQEGHPDARPKGHREGRQGSLLEGTGASFVLVAFRL